MAFAWLLAAFWMVSAHRQVPSLAPFYARQGLEAYFARLVAREPSWSSKLLLTALRSIVARVERGESAVPGCEGLQELVETCQRIYGLLAEVVKENVEEMKELRRCFRAERLLVLPGPKRLVAREAWWRAAEELLEVESVSALGLQRFYDPALESFFIQLGVHEAMDRATLVALLRRPQEPLLSKWSGLQAIQAGP